MFDPDPAALADCTFVFETVRGETDVKRQVCRTIRAYAAENAVIASTTSSLDAEIQSTTVNGLKTGDAGLKAGRGLYDWSLKDIPDYQCRKQAPFWDVARSWKLPG